MFFVLDLTAGDVHGKNNVFKSGIFCDQVEALKNDADIFGAEGILIDFSNALTIVQNIALVGSRETGEQGEQGGLSGTGLTNDAIDLSFFKFIGNMPAFRWNDGSGDNC